MCSFEKSAKVRGVLILEILFLFGEDSNFGASVGVSVEASPSTFYSFRLRVKVGLIKSSVMLVVEPIEVWIVVVVVVAVTVTVAFAIIFDPINIAEN